MLCLLGALFLCVLQATAVGTAVDDYLALRAAFAARSAFGKGPQLNPKVKIFNFDDLTVNALQTTELGLDDWALVLEALAAAKPKHIIIDKIFAMPAGLAGAAGFNERLRRLATPVVAGGFVLPLAMTSRPPLALDKPWNHLPEQGRWSQPRAKLYAYGPHPAIEASFAYIGHIVYAGGGRVAPFLQTDSSTVLPHLGFAVAGELGYRGDQLLTSQQPVPLHAGLIQVNVPGQAHFAQRSYSMKDLVHAAREHRPISVVAPGDEVLLLPAMYTGSTDWVMTPAGQLPGAYMVVGVINSALNGVWLRDSGGAPLLIVAGALLGGLCSVYCWGFGFWLALGLGAVSAVVAGLGAFVAFDLIVPWFYSVLAFLFAGLTLFAERSQRDRIERVKMDQELTTAALVQQAFMPQPAVDFGALRLRGHLQPSGPCGGDWWWYFAPAPDVVLVLIGDVMGHGVPAALITAMMYASLSSVAELGEAEAAGRQSPQQLLHNLNKMMFNAFAGKVTMTMFIGRFDTASGTLSYAGAGHCFPVLLTRPERPRPAVPTPSEPRVSLSKGVAYSLLQSRNNVLGIDPAEVYAERTIKLYPGERLVLYTDGLVEHHDLKNPSWGLRSFIACLAGFASADAPAMLAGVLADLAARSVNSEQEDDCTLVIVDVVPKTPQFGV